MLLPSAQAAPREIIIDTDPGTDDAMAIMLDLNSPELEVRAITVVPGNVTAKQGLDNALRMLSLIALAVEKDPSIVPLVKEVILMGGSIRRQLHGRR
jgi:inosine-uridine nucleoside N-ribohydrolase